MPLQGHCNCEAVKVTINDPPAGEEPYSSVYCHCTTCKRQSGASGTYVIVADEDKVNIEGKLTQWEDTLTDSGTPLIRSFCGTCGCPVTSVTPLYAGKIIVKMGLFDTIPKATAEYYTKNKQAWEPSVAGAPQVHAAS